MPERFEPGRALIVGGGITGLAAAHALRSHARPPRITVVETEPVFGGKITTERSNGFVIEAGPDSFITRKRAAVELVEELGLGDRLQGTRQRHRRVFVLKRGRLVPLPTGMTLLVPTRLGPVLRSPLLSPWGKVRLAFDLVRPARNSDADESLAGLVRRRFGREVLDTVAGPLLAGIHSADPDRLSIQATFPRFAEMERRHGSLIRAVRRALADAAGGLPSPTSARTTLSGGMDEMVTALVGRLRAAPPEAVRLRAGRQVTSLRRCGLEGEAANTWEATLSDGSTERAEVVVLAVPSAAAATILTGSEPGLAAELRRFPSSASAIVTLGFRRRDVAHPLDGYGWVVPTREGRRITACTWTSSKLEHRAPEGHVLLRVFVGGPRNQGLVELGDTALEELALSEVTSVVGPTGPPVVVRVHRVAGGNPLYEVGHLERLAALEATSPPGLVFAGAAFHGVGIPDCIESARRAALRSAEHLARLSPQPAVLAAAS